MIVGWSRIATVDVGVPTVTIHVLFVDVETAHGVVLGGTGCSRWGWDVERHLVPFSPCLAILGGGRMERSASETLQHPHILPVVLFICMDGLSMLAQIVETGELFRAMASKGALASMFPEWR